MSRREKDELDNKFTIIHTNPKMNDVEREKNKKIIGNELYEVFLRIQTGLGACNEAPDSEQ